MDLSEFAYGTQCPGAASGTTAAAPTAGTAVATIASGQLGVGTYDIAVVSRTEGTPDPLDQNMELRVGATVIQNKLASTSQPGRIMAVTDVQVPAATAISVNVTANAGTGAVYRAAIIASRNG
jgi:precorrin-6x reductase